MTTEQLATLKAHIESSPDLSAFPNTPDGNIEVANLLNLPAAPAFYAWRSNLTRSEIYHKPGLGADGVTVSVWDWGVFKAQSVTEQNTWTQMFMGDNAPMNSLNMRDGVFNVFGNAVGTVSGKQRVHVFNAGRRKATRFEKLFASAPVGVGTIVVGPDNGNTPNQPLGSAANPAVLAVEGNVSPSAVETARNL